VEVICGLTCDTAGANQRACFSTDVILEHSVSTTTDGLPEEPKQFCTATAGLKLPAHREWQNKSSGRRTGRGLDCVAVRGDVVG
jgi:hypothetical protein